MAHQLERFGKYILLEKLAAGGMAEVYLSKNTGANGVSKFVAIKRILPQYSDNEEFVKMFKEEAKIAVNLSHSNVVQIHEFGVERNQFYLVMEYVEGRNLRQIVNELKKQDNHLRIDQVVFIVKEVAAGLDHAHRSLDGTTGKPLNIIHRDMSPQNIMVSFDGEIKIIDFGIAKAASQTEATQIGTLKGKFGYMSPEQAESSKIDSRTDVFSLGIVLWELLAKERLFSASNEANILEKVRDCAVPSLRKINPSIHPDLEKIIKKALAKDRELRYQTSAAFEKDLNIFLNTYYPEFSPHDFSLFIKTAFAESYSEQKAKLIEFSQAQAEPIEFETHTVTRVSEKLKPQFKEQKEKNKSLPIPKSNGAELNRRLVYHQEQTDSINKQISVARIEASLTNGSSIKTQRTRGNSEKSKVTSANSVLTLVAFIIVIAIGSFTYKKQFLDVQTTASPVEPNTTTKSDQKESQDGETQQSSKMKAITVRFESNPSGAQVILNGKLIGKSPLSHTVEVNAETEANLEYKLDGHFDFKKSMFFKAENPVVKERLYPERWGFLIINARGAGSRYEVKIDQVSSDEYKLRKEIKVRAGMPLKIEITNSLGLKADQEVTVEENAHKTIELLLN